MPGEPWLHWSDKPLRRSERWVRLTTLSFVASPLLGAYWSGARERTSPVGIIPCPIRALTGLPCPGCGMARALGAIAQGDFVLALQYHAFSPLVALLCGAIVTVILLELAVGSALKSPQLKAGMARSRQLPIYLAVSVFAYHFTRLWLWETQDT